jgi:hypothetical protein
MMCGENGNIAKIAKDFEYAKVLLGKSLSIVGAFCRPVF